LELVGWRRTDGHGEVTQARTTVIISRAGGEGAGQLDTAQDRLAAVEPPLAETVTSTLSEHIPEVFRDDDGA
jgi:hypothetical protein